MSEEPAFEELLKMTARAGDLVDEKAVLTARVAELEKCLREIQTLTMVRSDASHGFMRVVYAKAAEAVGEYR